MIEERRFCAWGRAVSNNGFSGAGSGISRRPTLGGGFGSCSLFLVSDFCLLV
jgi:hypothetical protein